MDAMINRLTIATFMLSKDDKTMVIPKITKKNVRTTKAVSRVTICNS